MAVTPTDAALYNARRRHRLFRMVSAFRDTGLVASPHDFGSVAADASSSSGLTLPQTAEFAVALDAAWTAGEISLEDNAGQAVAGRGGAAGEIVRIAGRFPRGRILQVARALGAPAGAFSLYLVGQDRPVLVGSATFT